MKPSELTELAWLTLREGARPSSFGARSIRRSPHRAAVSWPCA